MHYEQVDCTVLDIVDRLICVEHRLIIAVISLIR